MKSAVDGGNEKEQQPAGTMAAVNRKLPIGFTETVISAKAQVCWTLEPRRQHERTSAVVLFLFPPFLSFDSVTLLCAYSFSCSRLRWIEYLTPRTLKPNLQTTDYV